MARRSMLLAGLVSAAAALATATPATAAPNCRNSVEPRTIASGLGTLESVIAGPDGRLYFTSDDGLLRISRPGRTPQTVTRPVEAPGGLVVDGRHLILGYGTSIAGGVGGNLLPRAGLLRIDPRTGDSQVLVRGLQMANGLARGRDGTIYASNDFGIGIDRVRGTRVELSWATAISGNGLVLSEDGRSLYAAQTFQPAAIQRIAIDRPKQPSTFARPNGPLDIFAGLDGMTRDGSDRLFVAANLFGEVWRVDRAGQICVVARGLNMPSAVAFGGGKRGFERRNLYVVEFGGRVSELARARNARSG
ncbi:MAG: SMP-30/gluconolactonase/LRE family protein [Thermoleophilaceae bacterium]|nr:SMP-30/gluconolactonase/LRE family protein [Thermoleophilaceae bacterium]